jgi:predicted PurR-regulated permease PerM
MSDAAPFEFNPLRFAAWSVGWAVIVSLLVLGSGLLVPLAIAVFIWILIAAIRSTLNRIKPGDTPVPGWIANSMAIVVMLIATYLGILVITSQSDQLAAAIPSYQANFAAILASFMARFGLEELPTTETLLSQVDLGAVLGWVGDSVTALMSDVVLIAIYVGFLLAEEHVLPAKIRHLHADPEKAERISRLAADVAASIQRYIGMKTVISLATAAVSYAILVMVGVDFAAVWALLVFFLNFIPTIGSIIAAVFPSLLALVQFETLTPFVIVAAGLGGAQFLFGNVIEPAYMGRSLNLSSMAILLSLSFWGIVWGLAGMFLAVPMMVMTAIVCAQFKGLRWVAVLLSTDGNLVADTRSAPSSS